MERILFICQCENTEHQMIFSYFPDDEDREVSISIYLRPESSIFQRIKNAVKYILGHRSRFGDFDNFLLRKEDVGKLQKVIDYLKS